MYYVNCEDQKKIKNIISDTIPISHYFKNTVKENNLSLYADGRRFQKVFYYINLIIVQCRCSDSDKT